MSKWYGRWKDGGEEALLDKSSRPDRSPSATSDDIVAPATTGELLEPKPDDEMTVEITPEQLSIFDY